MSDDLAGEDNGTRALAESLKLGPYREPEGESAATRPLILDREGSSEILATVSYARPTFTNVRTDPVFGVLVDDVRRVIWQYDLSTRFLLRPRWELGVDVPYVVQREGRESIVPATALTAADVVEQRTRIQGLNAFALRLSREIELGRPQLLGEHVIDLILTWDGVDQDVAPQTISAIGTGQRSYTVQYRGQGRNASGKFTLSTSLRFFEAETQQDPVLGRVTRQPGLEFAAAARGDFPLTPWLVTNLEISTATARELVVNSVAVPGTNPLALTCTGGLTVPATEGLEVSYEVAVPVISDHVPTSVGYSVLVRQSF